MTHDRWRGGLVFEQRAAAVSFADYRAALAERDATLAAIEADWWPFAAAGPFAECVHRRGAYRGIARLGALVIASEVIDWRRFARGASFRDFTGLVPSEHSSGEATRRGQITKTGNTPLRTQLVESAWASQHGPAVGVEDPGGLFAFHAASSSSRQVRWLVRVRSSGWPFRHACSRIRLRAVAA